MERDRDPGVTAGASRDTIANDAMPLLHGAILRLPLRPVSVSTPEDFVHVLLLRQGVRARRREAEGLRKFRLDLPEFPAAVLRQELGRQPLPLLRRRRRQRDDDSASALDRRRINPASPLLGTNAHAARPQDRPRR